MTIPFARSQQISRVERDLALAMLDNVSSDVKKYYFDPKLNGLDWDELVREAKLNITKAPNVDAAQSQIEGLLEQLNDSHTTLFPPRKMFSVDYGWNFKIIGNRAYVTQVSPRSDAAEKGIQPGDEVLTINRFAVDRAGIAKLKMAMNELSPRSALDLDLREPTGKLLHLTVAAKVKEHLAADGFGDYSRGLQQRIIDWEKQQNAGKVKYKELGSELMVIRIPAFYEYGVDIDSLMKKAREHKALIVDLRGNRGGAVESVKRYLADILIGDTKLGNWVERGKIDPVSVKSNIKCAFRGDLIVLVDSETASGGEIFARAVQLNERGTILGDHTSGRTMEARINIHNYLGYTYADEVTIGDTVMADGKSLEHVGVKPDRVFLPTPADLAAGRDPVLAYAAGLAGVTLSPEEAAKLFPPEE